MSLNDYFTSTLTTLSLDNNSIGDEGAKYLADALRENDVISLRHFLIILITHCFIQVLTTLDLRTNDIDTPGAQYLANALIENKVKFLSRFLIVSFTHYFT
jgi:Ran GTPase-activating protein (RanGAP) involved in mRNA processing and transport